MGDKKKGGGGDDGPGIDPNGWMITFSDLLTLMLTFFVLLFSMSSLDAKSLKELTETEMQAAMVCSRSVSRRRFRRWTPRTSQPSPSKDILSRMWRNICGWLGGRLRRGYVLWSSGFVSVGREG